MTESEVTESQIAKSEITESPVAEPEKWCCFAASVVGASHKRKTPPMPNQDAYAVKPEAQDDRSQGVSSFGVSHQILLVADGHGSGKSFRSDVGSRLAVDEAASYLWDSFGQSTATDPYEVIYDFCRTKLPERLVRLWIEAVRNHLQQNPFTEAETQLLPTAEEVVGSATTPQSKRLDLQQLREGYAYGTTLLGVVITDRFILYLQLGDGDIVCVDSTGKSDRPFPKDPALIANETTSLCLVNAWGHFRIKITPIQSHCPALIFVSTDGYSNSFPSDQDFLENVVDHLPWLREEVNLEGSPHELKELKSRIEEDLTHTLEEVSEKGSGDDITVGMLARCSFLSSPISIPEPNETEEDSPPLVDEPIAETNP